MADLSVVPIKGKLARLIQLDACGNPITGASGLQVITKGFIQIQAEPQYEDGEQQRQRLADGTFCVNEDDDDSMTNVQLTIDFCGVCPSVSQVTNGARLLTAGAPVTGTGAAYAEGLITAHWSLEIWQLVTGRGACDPATGLQRYVYWAFPNVSNGKVGSLTIENAALTMQIMAKTKAVGYLWGDGPGSLGPWAPAFADGEHYLWNITEVLPPTIPVNCGATTIT
jgi:hypothetical protein